MEEKVYSTYLVIAGALQGSCLSKEYDMQGALTICRKELYDKKIAAEIINTMDIEDGITRVITSNPLYSFAIFEEKPDADDIQIFEEYRKISREVD